MLTVYSDVFLMLSPLKLKVMLYIMKLDNFIPFNRKENGDSRLF